MKCSMLAKIRCVSPSPAVSVITKPFLYIAKCYEPISFKSHVTKTLLHRIESVSVEINVKEKVTIVERAMILLLLFMTVSLGVSSL